MYKKKELQLSYFSICEGKKLDDKIVTYFALKVHETFMRKDMKHSNFSNYFIICLPSFFSIIEVIIELFVIYVYA